jgi:phosphoglycerol transferase MdoB-like AlkP superfamily enzyme
VHSFFQDLVFSEVVYSFFQGIRFDLLSIFTFLGLFFLIINIPVNSKLLIKINCCILNTLCLIFSILLASDIIYFKLFKKHLTTELLLAKSHFDYFLDLALHDYFVVTLIIIGFIILLFYFTLKLIDKYYVPPNKNLSFNIIALSLLVFVMFFFIRGRLTYKNLSIIDAYAKKYTIGELSLNGIFTSYTSLRKKQMPNIINISEEETLEIVKSNLIENNEEITPNPQYPLMRQRIKFNVNGKNYNVIVILLESWQKDYIDSISGTQYGVTPNFDELVKNSLVYDNFYANGQRSIMGLMSVFFSIPHVKGLPYMGYGLENFGQTRLPAILSKNGYDNVYVQGDKRESDKACFLANYHGFKNSYGKQDIPLIYKYDVSISKGYDIEGLDFFFKKVNNLKTPFFAFYFTTTTHIPYAKTILKSLEKYQEDGKEKTGYLNRLYYADYALGNFMENAKKQPWFDNTVFIMVTDHQAYGVGGMFGEYEKTKVDKIFKIPMIIYCPKLFKPEKINKLGSQFDLVPTIIDILNIQTPYSSMGKSLFSDSVNRFAFLSYEGEQVYLINNDGVVSKDWTNSLNNESGSGTNLMFAIEKTVHSLVVKDKWFDRNSLN